MSYSQSGGSGTNRIVCSVAGRDEVAGCSEQAYPSITVAHARQLLMFNNDTAALEYGSQVRTRLVQLVRFWAVFRHVPILAHHLAVTAHWALVAYASLHAKNETDGLSVACLSLIWTVTVGILLVEESHGPLHVFCWRAAERLGASEWLDILPARARKGGPGH